MSQQFYRQFSNLELLDKLVEAFEERDTVLSRRPAGRAGIAVDKDAQARQWQGFNKQAGKLYDELRGRLVVIEADRTPSTEFTGDPQGLGV